MAKSKSKKTLQHRLKNNLNIDPRNSRGTFGIIDGVSKQTPTLQEKKNKQNSKHKKRSQVDDYVYFLSSLL